MWTAMDLHGLMVFTGLSILHGWLFLNVFPIMDMIYILNFSPEEVFHLMQKIMIITILPRDLHGMKQTHLDGHVSISEKKEVWHGHLVVLP
ncbi:hypothetical protein AWF44_25740 [Escherichia coli]|nr:hypothetical protein AWF40_26060 [Escherichia coli]KUV38794.1 hypothetical protein AWF44_25740 [Escherichia coli]KXL00292.1 hypothetical protein AXH20_00040 [Escherichia coli]KZI73474.1 hypothetical protein AWG77_23065 [Escherichia coli]OWF24816.1 hypothetical protein A9X62_20725 [Escherichia coli]